MIRLPQQLVQAAATTSACARCSFRLPHPLAFRHYVLGASELRMAYVILRRQQRCERQADLILTSGVELNASFVFARCSRAALHLTDSDERHLDSAGIG
jgi:hypothetical protein